ncbi:unnamed protein product [Peronospora effusa]|nr:unnamed protein product [Peronospora effusa]
MQTATTALSSGRRKTKSWTRSSHYTSGAAKRAQKAAAQEKPVSNTSTVNHVYERDPKNYGEALRSLKRNDWEKAMREVLEALESNDVWRLVKTSKRQQCTLHESGCTRRRRLQMETSNA